jgi:hypothetical protein
MYLQSQLCHSSLYKHQYWQKKIYFYCLYFCLECTRLKVHRWTIESNGIIMDANEVLMQMLFHSRLRNIAWHKGLQGQISLGQVDLRKVKHSSLARLLRISNMVINVHCESLRKIIYVSRHLCIYVSMYACMCVCMYVSIYLSIIGGVRSRFVRPVHEVWKISQKKSWNWRISKELYILLKKGKGPDARRSIGLEWG